MLSYLYVFAINIFLSTDNAIAIGTVAMDVPKEKKKIVFSSGVFFAVFIRLFLVFFISWLYHLYIIHIIGAIFLFIIAMVSLRNKKHTRGKKGVKEILVVDFILSLDNMLAVVGAANGNIKIVIICVLIAIPIVYIASYYLTSVLLKYKVLKYIASAILIYIGVTILIQ